MAAVPPTGAGSEQKRAAAVVADVSDSGDESDGIEDACGLIIEPDVETVGALLSNFSRDWQAYVACDRALTDLGGRIRESRSAAEETNWVSLKRAQLLILKKLMQSYSDFRGEWGRAPTDMCNWLDKQEKYCATWDDRVVESARLWSVLASSYGIRPLVAAVPVENKQLDEAIEKLMFACFAPSAPAAAASTATPAAAATPTPAAESRYAGRRRAKLAD